MTQSASPTDTPAIDLSDHDLFTDAVPHVLFARLRREDPVHWNPEPDGTGFWAVTRYEDIRTVHRHPEVFSSELGGTSLEDLEPEHIEARKSMIDTDPPRHGELRGLVNRRFTPRAVQAWEAAVRRVVDIVLDRALPLERFDFIAEIAAEIPMQVFAEILGVPQEQRREIIEIGDRLLGNADPEYAVPPDEAHRHLPFSSPAALDMFAFGRRIAAERRTHPRADIMSDLVTAGLSERELDVYFVLLATAGNETTRHTISHGLIALAEHPEAREALAADPDGLGVRATEEMLRWATPVHHFRRTAAVDTELAGTPIAAGDKVTTWLVSGNRDETVFDDPDRFDITRDPNPHMAFGPGGIHHCLGAHLARLEIRLTFTELLRREVDFELTAPPERLRSNFFNGIKRLPVRVTG
ncbi:cytochrome P450 [Conexibacter sp. DBS9H8]|uniref:cytochrome P450 n=1 Tax=Conexibacter sp. DBS9H8 TaxID=2937801 RepID=UPI00201088D9|nr:cytochrome P450 [Conexibacter sp. DBS9H8]